MPRLNSRSRGFVLGAAMALMVKGPLLTAAFAWTSDAVRGLDSTQAWVHQSQTVITEAGRMLSAVSDAERSQRDFLLTGNAGALEPYQAAILRVGTSINTLGRLTAGTEQDVATLRKLWQVTDARLEDLAVNVEKRRETGSATLGPEDLARGQRLMEDVRTTVAALQAGEMRSLEARLSAAGYEAKRALVSVTAAGVIAFGLIIMAAITLRRRPAAIDLNQIRLSLAR
jgi:CHASE3 domain sensor protein